MEPEKCISTHIMQVEYLNIFGDNDPERILLTDFDYFLKGNPYVEGWLTWKKDFLRHQETDIYLIWKLFLEFCQIAYVTLKKRQGNRLG